MHRKTAKIVILVHLAVAPLISQAAEQSPQPLSAQERQKIDADRASLDAAIKAIGNVPAANLADVLVFQKGLTWALDYDSEFSPADVDLLYRSIERGLERARELGTGQRRWATRQSDLAWHGACD